MRAIFIDSGRRGAIVAFLAALLMAPGTGAAEERLNRNPPKGAVVLFDGKGANLFVSAAGGAVDWPVEDGALVSTPDGRRSNYVVSRLLFRDAEIHVEFLLPSGGDGNSGVYFHGEYELQILNTPPTRVPTDKDLGALYGLHKPLVNAARPAGEWQAYDIHLVAPRRDADGKIVAEGRVTAWLNGRQVHDRAVLGGETSAYNAYAYGTTPYLKTMQQLEQQRSTGPLILQDHDCPVRFRNIWVKPLDAHAFLYDAGSSVPDAR